MDTAMDIADIEKRISQRAAGLQALGALAPKIGEAAKCMEAALGGGGKILLCGNGGSAADSQHLAAELMGRFMRERAPQAAVALTTDTSALTAIGNDYGFEEVFARQIRGLGRGGDVLIAISTSGNSANVLRAAAAAAEKDMTVIALTGAAGGKLAACAGVVINVPATRTDYIQEMHIIVGHILCEIVEGEI